MPNAAIGIRIAEARQKGPTCLTQRELALRLKEAGLNITPADLAAIESGRRSLTYFERTILASTLKIPHHQLIV